MNMEMAEQVADSITSTDDATRREAFAYLEKRFNDNSLSEDFRGRAIAARNKIINYFYAQACKQHPVASTKQKRTRI